MDTHVWWEDKVILRIGTGPTRDYRLQYSNLKVTGVRLEADGEAA